MVNGIGAAGFYTRNLRFQRGNAGIQFIDRKTIDVFFLKQGQRIIAPRGEKIIGIHSEGEVTRTNIAVNHLQHSCNSAFDGGPTARDGCPWDGQGIGRRCAFGHGTAGPLS